MNILHIDSSITGDHSVSRSFSRSVVDRLVAAHPDAVLVRRDLIAAPLPYFDDETLADIGVVAEPGHGEHPEEERLQRIVLREFMAADVIVLGVPMYNFGIPAQLKTWIDYLAVAGVTFRYTPEGPRGLAGGKRVIIASSRGNIYAPGTPQAAAEHQVSHLVAVMRFFGIDAIETIQAEGVRIPHLAEGQLAQARSAVEALAV